MQDEVAVAIAAGIIERRELLQSLTLEQQTTLLEKLFMEFFGDLHTTLQKWAALTGQTAQVDTGYIAQFVASIVLKEPGQGFRGKGDDLADGSEVKSAAIISGVDRPQPKTEPGARRGTSSISSPTGPHPTRTGHERSGFAAG